MKKLICVMTILCSLILTSCNTQFGLAYGVSLTGDGDGQFEVTFPQGSYAMDGKATLTLNIGDTILFNHDTITTKEEVLLHGDKKQLTAMKAVNDSIANQFNAFVGDGTYDLWIKGYVKEIGTGLVFSVDRHLTNRENVLRMPSLEADPYPFIR